MFRNALLSFLLPAIILQAQPKTDSIELYMKCGNWMSVQAMYPKYDPKSSVLNVLGGRLIENKDNDKIVIMPDSSVVLLQIKQKGKIVHTLKMYGRRTPSPFVIVKINNKSYFPSFASSGPMPTSIQVEAEADGAFQDMIPKDATYRVTAWETILLRNGKELFRLPLKDTRMPAADVNRLKSLARRGDTMQINVISVKRRNAVGEMIPATLSEKTVTYTIE